MTDETIRLVLVDDQALVRAGFRMVLHAQPDMAVVGEAGDGRAALDLLATTPADIVLMDVRMPRMDGVAATEAIGGMDEGPRVIVLTTFDLDEYAHAALRAGASGFLLKDAGPEELLAAIRAVDRGDSVIAPSTTRRLIERFSPHLRGAGSPAPDPTADPRLAELTPRELEVLRAVARGLTNAEISAELHLAEATVKTHIGRILAKAHLRDRVHMVLLAHETGLVDVRPRS
ncbi:MULTISPECIES: response regulator [Janibacter]|uniref:Two component transcriptional regulator, LuxR family n=1 Tax=Janibacter indicus TaxID=857417 RepID=A0A1W2C539_9MICO|nr:MULTISPECIES: response regulator transcription factor [Janibacter]QNF95606.1 response regulator transcription factor [Janibacter sp. YB324]SMC80329.1 two component transcriptional regulator, LuxR family [Janibacter indicus]